MEMDRAHLKGEAKRVIISAPSATAAMFAVSVNCEKYDSSHKIASRASCITNCLGSLAKVIHDNFGTVERLMIRAHAIPATQKTVDDPSVKLWSDGNGDTQNIQGLCQGCGQGNFRDEWEKFTGWSFHAPTLGVSFMDLTCHLGKAVKYKDNKKMVKQV